MHARQPGDLRASFAHKAVAQFGEAKLAGNQCALVGAVGHRQRSAHHSADVVAARQPGAVEAGLDVDGKTVGRSEEHTSELQSLMRISYAVFCLKKKKNKTIPNPTQTTTCNNTTKFN